MEIRADVDVECADGLRGHCTQVVVDRRPERVTHLVVKVGRMPYTRYLVPIDQIVETYPNLIRLRCTIHSRIAMEPFRDAKYISAGGPFLPYATPMLPVPQALTVPVEHERVPEVELAVHCGVPVQATDGLIGWVDEYLVDPAEGRITHLVLREARPEDSRCVIVPVSQIERIEEEAVYLRLDTNFVPTLPFMPVRRPPAEDSLSRLGPE